MSCDGVEVIVPSMFSFVYLLLVPAVLGDILVYSYQLCVVFGFKSINPRGQWNVSKHVLLPMASWGAMGALWAISAISIKKPTCKIFTWPTTD